MYLFMNHLRCLNGNSSEERLRMLSCSDIVERLTVIDFPFQHAARLPFPEFGQDFQSLGAYRTEIHTVVTIGRHTVCRVVLHLAPLAVGGQIVERP